jgi:NADPH-dependent curcumin reductase CurA
VTATSTVDVPTEADALLLSRRPGVEPEPADFELTSVSVPAPRDGEVTVRNVLTSVDPYMLPRMQGRSSYASPFPLGEPVAADSIGEVVASAHLGVPVGSWLVSHSGWRTYATVAGSPADVIDRQIGDPVAWMSVLGMTGITAWFGLHDIGRVRPGETVLVNAAAGAVGSVVVQLAVHAGARVVAVAGSASKLRHIRELGAHEAVDYNAPAFDEALARACDSGVDVFFDNVGGRQLASALPLMRPHGRVVLCGRMSGLGADADPGLVDIGPAVPNRLSLQGFIVVDHLDRWPEIRGELAGLLAQGELRPVISITDGLHRAPDALAGLYRRGTNHIGKSLVRIAED